MLNLEIISDKIKKERCYSYECQVITTLSAALYDAAGYYFPNSMAQGPPPDNSGEIMLRKVQKSVFLYPEMFSEYCKILTKIPRSIKKDVFIDGILAIDVALVMDQKKGHCTPKVVAAFPKGPKIDRYINEEIAPGCRELKLGRCEDVHRP